MTQNNYICIVYIVCSTMSNMQWWPGSDEVIPSNPDFQGEDDATTLQNQQPVVVTQVTQGAVLNILNFLENRDWNPKDLDDIGKKSTTDTEAPPEVA